MPIIKSKSYKLKKSFSDFEFVPKDTIIAIDVGEELKAPEDSMILFASPKNMVGAEAFVLGREVK